MFLCGMDSPSTSPDPAADLYRGSMGREYHEHKRALPDQAVPWIMEQRAEKLQPFISSSDVVFEFGAGAGWNLGALSCASKKAHDAAEFLRDKIVAAGAEFVADPSELADDSINVVLLHHSLEHLLKPAECLQGLRRVLKPGGRLIIHVPWEREKRYRKYSEREPNHHLYTWNSQTLGNLVVSCGYDLQSIRTRRYGYDRFAGAMAAKCRLGRPGFRLLRHFLILARPLLEVELVAARPQIDGKKSEKP
jgi:SAM-dependent methyltransferase